MAHDRLAALQREWEVLHRDHESYERCALAIKLLAVVLSLACLAYGIDSVLAIFFMLTLWLQDGIWKTFQARLSARILSVEQTMHAPTGDAVAPFHLYTAWEAGKHSTAGLIKEYVMNALRPTVAYPYVVLVVISFLFGVSEV